MYDRTTASSPLALIAHSALFLRWPVAWWDGSTPDRSWRGPASIRLAPAEDPPCEAGATAVYMVQVFRTSARSFHAVIAASRTSFGSIGLTPTIMSTSRMP